MKDLSCIMADVDECEYLDTNDCQQVCVNTRGSYKCGCRAGYTLVNGTQCQGKIQNNIKSNVLLVYIHHIMIFCEQISTSVKLLELTIASTRASISSAPSLAPVDPAMSWPKTDSVVMVRTY